MREPSLREKRVEEAPVGSIPPDDDDPRTRRGGGGRSRRRPGGPGGRDEKGGSAEKEVTASHRKKKGKPFGFPSSLTGKSAQNEMRAPTRNTRGVRHAMSLLKFGFWARAFVRGPLRRVGVES